MNPTQLNLARELETKLQETLAASEALSEFERTHEVAVPVAFTGLHRDRVEQWASRLDEVAAGTRTV